MEPEPKKKALEATAIAGQGISDIKQETSREELASPLVKFAASRLSTFPPIHAVKQLGKWIYVLRRP